MKSLVGYTGFVGSNLARTANFTNLYNSKNIQDSYGTHPDLLVYAGVRAEKYLANSNQERDLRIVQEAFENIKKINSKKLVLISTIDVYRNPGGVDEDSEIETAELQPYGLHRYQLEQWVRKGFPDCLVVRLPGLYGKNIKKNFIYDLINLIPFMLSEEKYAVLQAKDNMISQCYQKQDNGFYKCRLLNSEERGHLRAVFENIGFSALNFTDSRARFQFYNLFFLADHIRIALNNGIRLLNLATEPVEVAELYRYIKNEYFENHILEHPPEYNYKTKYAELFNAQGPYILKKDFILEDIKKFVEGFDPQCN